MQNQSDIQITRPEDRELETKRSELAALEANLAERELQLASSARRAFFLRTQISRRSGYALCRA